MAFYLGSVSTPAIPHDPLEGMGMKPVAATREKTAYYQDFVDEMLQRRRERLEIWSEVDRMYRAEGSVLVSSAANPLLNKVSFGRVYSAVHTTESQVYPGRVAFKLRGNRGDEELEKIPVLERALTAEWLENYELDHQVRLTIRDACRYGIGVGISRIEADYDPEELAEAALEQRRLAVENPALAEAVDALEAELGGTIARGPSPLMEETFEGSSLVHKDRISFQRISPWNLLIDDYRGGFDQVRMIGRIIHADIEAVKADPLLRNTENLKPTYIWRHDGSHVEDRMRDRTSSTRKWRPNHEVVLYELFERIPGKGWRMVTMAEGHDQFLRVVERPFWIGCPYSILAWNDNGEDVFPQSDIEVPMGLYMAEEHLVTRVLDGYAREQEDTTFYDSSAGVSEEDLNAASDPTIGKYVKVTKAQQRDLRQIFWKVPRDPKSPEILNFAALLERAQQVASGLGPNQFGLPNKSGTTAREVREISNFVDLRSGHKSAATIAYLADIASKRLGLMAQFYGADRIARTLGPKAAEAWAGFNLTEGDVQAGLRLVIDPVSVQPPTQDSRLQLQLQLLQLLLSAPTLVLGSIDPSVIIRQIVREFGYPDDSPIWLTSPGEHQEAAGGILQTELMGKLGVGKGASRNGNATGSLPSPSGVQR